MTKYLEIKKRFAENQNKEKAVKMAAYMRNLFSFYGLQASKRKLLYIDFLKQEKKNKSINWKFLDQCWENKHREFQYLVVDYLKIMQQFLNYDDIKKIKNYIKTKQWWDTIDGLDRIVGSIAFSDGRVNDLMLKWSKDSDFWVRRIAIDHQLCRKETSIKQ